MQFSQFYAKLTAFSIKKCLRIRLLCKTLMLKRLAVNSTKYNVKMLKLTSRARESSYIPWCKTTFLAPVSDAEMPVVYARTNNHFSNPECSS